MGKRERERGGRFGVQCVKVFKSQRQTLFISKSLESCVFSGWSRVQAKFGQVLATDCDCDRQAAKMAKYCPSI